MANWYIDENGGVYSSDGDFGDTFIPAPPGPLEDWEYRNGNWRQISQTEKDKKKDDELDEIILSSKVTAALVKTIAELHSMTEKEITDMMKVYYKQ